MIRLCTDNRRRDTVAANDNHLNGAGGVLLRLLHHRCDRVVLTIRARYEKQDGMSGRLEDVEERSLLPGRIDQPSCLRCAVPCANTTLGAIPLICERLHLVLGSSLVSAGVEDDRTVAVVDPKLHQGGILVLLKRVLARSVVLLRRVLWLIPDHVGENLIAGREHLCHNGDALDVIGLEQCRRSQALAYEG